MASGWLAVVISVFAVSCFAQDTPARNFPESALSGRFEVLQPPDVLLDGKPARLAPGVRIRNENNLLVTSATLIGKTYRANYVLDTAGELQHVWLLNDTEAKQPRASASGDGIWSWFGL